MPHSSYRLLALVAALAAVPAVVAGDQGGIVSTFETNAEGWVSVDLNCSNFNSVLSQAAVNHQASGGDPGGCISAVDPSGNCYAFQAPAAYLGNQSAFVGSQFSFSIRTTANDWLPGSVFILVGDNGKVLVHDFAHPTSAWQRVGVPLVAGSFRQNTAGGAAVSEALFLAVMGDLEQVRISAEFADQAGEENSFLDSVHMGELPCPADLNNSGTVDGADLGILLAAWGSGGTTADLNGSGLVDGADLGALLAAWGPCP
jgi:hypothetical protein